MTPEWFLVGGAGLIGLAFIVTFWPRLHLWCGLECRRCDQRRVMRDAAARRARRAEVLAHNRSTVDAWRHGLERPRGKHARRAVVGDRVRVVMR